VVVAVVARVVAEGVFELLGDGGFVVRGLDAEVEAEETDVVVTVWGDDFVKVVRMFPLVVSVGLTGVGGVEGTGASSPLHSTFAGQSQVPYLGLA